MKSIRFRFKNLLNSDGLTMIEVLVSTFILAVAVIIYTRVSTPVVKMNRYTTQYNKATATIGAILDSLMTLSLTQVDSANGKIITKNGVSVSVTVSTISASEAEAILPGMNANVLRKIRAVDGSNTSVLETTISRAGVKGSSHCYSL